MDPKNWIPTPSDIVILQQSRWLSDPATALDVAAPDAVSTLNIDGSTMPMGGETVGRDAVLAKVLQFRSIFEILDYRPRIYAAEGEIVRSRVNMKLRHKKTGEVVVCKKRTVYTVRNGLIVRVDEYVDQPMMETFMRLVTRLEA